MRSQWTARFADVLRALRRAARGSGGTWLVPPMIRAYTRLHDSGFAHSVEVWMDGEIAGGLYGVAVGRMFYGESMFTRRTDASKIALVALVAQLSRWGFPIIDCQMRTAHLASLGAFDMPRRQFQAGRAAGREPAAPGAWTPTTTHRESCCIFSASASKRGSSEACRAPDRS